MLFHTGFLKGSSRNIKTRNGVCNLWMALHAAHRMFSLFYRQTLALSIANKAEFLLAWIFTMISALMKVALRLRLPKRWCFPGISFPFQVPVLRLLYTKIPAQDQAFAPNHPCNCFGTTRLCGPATKPTSCQNATPLSFIWVKNSYNPQMYS